MNRSILFGITSVALIATMLLHHLQQFNMYRTCIVLQIMTLLGISIDSFVLIQTGHVGFAMALYYGAFTLPPPHTWLVISLCLVTLLTRYMLGGCLFDMITHRSYTHSYIADIFFTVPVFVCAVRLGS